MDLVRRIPIIEAIDEAVKARARLCKACEAIGLCERRLRRWRRADDGDARLGGYRAVNQRLTEVEKDAIVTALESPELCQLPLKGAHALLMDQGIYLASPSSFARVMNQRYPERTGAGKRGQLRKRPELAATGPGQVWCWDITWLNAAQAGKYFYLYMALDMYSRKVVAWEVHVKEDGRFARDLFSDAIYDEGIKEDRLIVHADNGRPMRSKNLRGLFSALKVAASYGRPHTSNDNAFAESLFATMKGRVSFPEFFQNLDAARTFCLEFFTWYNNFHLHSSLDYATPHSVHQGLHGKLFEARNILMEDNRKAHPSRHGGRIKVFGIPAVTRLKHRVAEVVAK